MPVASRPQKVFGDEEDVRWALGQAAHEVGIPLGAERDIDPQALAFSHQLLLQIAANAMQHLKFVRVARNIFGPRKCLTSVMIFSSCVARP